ncbi:preprotein translocase subunit SecE [Clostridium sp. CX1]|uniref:Protein translocase subunit SecE n=1 Tax=Clostridium tanneri TaxID=3037988 RepID=A0ABU4JPY6_9CLOT|nr:MULTISPECIES: preprotein translocase subunit SecE [unclassified Clostridium]MCT8976524.1 preprotein translocase subunit SecE [Clostridium sp. CX1]MDW8800190.1 preprotein translocase subunit SecE [Clostridium sp. A1-XYC3]
MAAQDNVKKVNKSAASGNGVISFFKELKAETKRITWASKENVKKATATVMTFCVIYVIIVGLLDFGFKNLIGVIFK